MYSKRVICSEGEPAYECCCFYVVAPSSCFWVRTSEVQNCSNPIDCTLGEPAGCNDNYGASLAVEVYYGNLLSNCDRIFGCSENIIPRLGLSRSACCALSISS